MKLGVAGLLAVAILSTGMAPLAPAAAGEPEAEGTTQSLAREVVKKGPKPKLTFKTIRADKVRWGHKARLRPAYRLVSGKRKSATLTVRQNGRVIARNQNSVALAAGTYKVTQKVKYRPYRDVWKRTVTPKGTKVRPDDCYVWSWDTELLTGEATCYFGESDSRFPGSGGFADFAVRGAEDSHGYIVISSPTNAFAPVTASSRSDLEWGFFEPAWVTTQRSYSAVRKNRVWSPVRTRERSQKIVIRSYPKPRGCALPSEYNYLDTVIDDGTWNTGDVAFLLESNGRLEDYNRYVETRSYPVCGGGRVWVGFFEEYAYYWMKF